MSPVRAPLWSLCLVLLAGSLGCEGEESGKEPGSEGGGGVDSGPSSDDGGGSGSGSGTGDPPSDRDGDGVPDGDDCEPDDPNAFPGGTEICNGVDDDCDGMVDNEATDAPTWYADGDGDGYGSAEDTEVSCERPLGYVETADDCDDGREDVYPGAPEVPYDGVDQDCAEGDLCDVDEDGFIAEECEGDDCADDEPTYYPGAPESGLLTGDANCDGRSSSGGSLADGDATLLGESAGDAAGFTVADAGDVDGDGLGDVLVSGHLADSRAEDSGRVYLFFGASLSGASMTEWSLGDADVIFVGESEDELAGYALSSAGDVDNDGLDDILIGAHQADGREGGEGKACIFLGSSIAAAASSTLSLADADHLLMGENAGEAAGRSVAPAGDVDNDGLDDVLIGAYFNSEAADRAGKVYLVLGSSLASSTTLDLADADYGFLGERANDYAGTTVSSAGDVDGDGLDDLMVGAFANDKGGNNAGAAYLWLASSLPSRSPATVSLVDADLRLVGFEENAWAGISLAPLGDLDGDGLGEVALGAMYGNAAGGRTGAVYLLEGSVAVASAGDALSIDTLFFTLLGVGREDGAGYSIDAGDADGDGLQDLLVGAYLNDDGGTHAGATYLVLGSSLLAASAASDELSVSAADFTFVGDGASDQSGRSVSFAGDVDGNGRSDLIVGASQSDDAAENAGKAVLLFSRL